MRFYGSLVGLKRFRLAWAAAVALSAVALPAAVGLAAQEPLPPTVSRTAAVNAPAGVLMSATAADLFDNAGTNPSITGAIFSTTDYYNEHSISNGRLWLQAKSPTELNALSSPPPSPFTVDVTVTMTNDEGQTASGTITFETTYGRAPASEQPSELPAPTFSGTAAVNAPAGVLISATAADLFDNAGTSPRISAAVFSTTEYYRVYQIGDGKLFVQPMTAAELSALESPPPSPVTVDVTVTMENAEGQTASGTITFETPYERDMSAEQPNEVPAPTFSVTGTVSLAPDVPHILHVDSVFANAGTNPRFVGLGWSHAAYLSNSGDDNDIPLSGPSDTLTVRVLPAAELNALPSPPPSPFTIRLNVSMTNDEGHQAEGIIALETTYDRAPTSTPSQPSESPAPTFSQTAAIDAPPGVAVSLLVDGVFDNAGTNPRFVGMGWSDTTYLSISGSNSDELPFSGPADPLTVRMLTAAELNALPSPPPSPFTLDASVSMTNDEGHQAEGVLTFETTYDRAPTSTPSQPSGPPPSVTEPGE